MYMKLLSNMYVVWMRVCVRARLGVHVCMYVRLSVRMRVCACACVCCGHDALWSITI